MIGWQQKKLPVQQAENNIQCFVGLL